MKKQIVAIICALSMISLSGCVRSGMADSIDFISSMMRLGFDCRVEEITSEDKLKESCYINGCKVSLFSNGYGKLTNISVTCARDNSEEFYEVALAATKSFCGYSQTDALTVFETLKLCEPLPADSKGVKRCLTEWYSFSFTCDDVGGALAVTSLRLEPTSAPEVTLNTTVPFVTLGSTEKAPS